MRLRNLEHAQHQLQQDAFAEAQVQQPATTPILIEEQVVPKFAIDRELVRALSELVIRKNLSLPETIRIWRGQTNASPSPNKALVAVHYPWLLHGYDHIKELIQSATHGVRHIFKPPHAGVQRNDPVPNHPSVKLMHNAFIRSIRDGQTNGSYLVISKSAASRWCLHFSPFGCVEKGDADPSVEARVIHDLSHPFGASTNSWSDQEAFPSLVHEVVSTIARRIVELHKANPSRVIKLMKGDVKAAYRNIPVYEHSCAYFAGSIPEEDIVVIDLALPFGWTGSAAHYGVFGKAITYLVRRESPKSMDPNESDDTTFFCFDWVDDHVLVEQDTSNRLESCDSALRLAITAVLGPRAINNKKFTVWATKLIALGLEWDSVALTVSMPESKIQKAIGRIQDTINATKTTRSKLSKLLGSLRHVCSCIRPAKPFFQRLVTQWRHAPRFRAFDVSSATYLDLLWFEHILRYGRLRGVPLDYFGELPEPVIHLFMDSSDEGLCILHPAENEYIRVRFDSSELSMMQDNIFSINVREQLSALFAVLCWGELWYSTFDLPLIHVRVWIDNISAVAWCNNLSSSNPLSQEMNRIFGAIEAEWGVRVSAGHLAGSTNFLADLGSRAWSGALLTQWYNLTSTWTQVQVPQSMRTAYNGGGRASAALPRGHVMTPVPVYMAAVDFVLSPNPAISMAS